MAVERRPDPFASALGSFTPRPGAKVNISRDEVTVVGVDEGVENEWLQPPSRDQCPSWQIVKGRPCYWGLDWLGVPYLLLDERGNPSFTALSFPDPRVLEALSYERIL